MCTFNIPSFTEAELGVSWLTCCVPSGKIGKNTR
uniref:Uncharacterized protein n=1 Tax=Anguilla anguilla TaxID=7936 RepID=A0A0E9P8H1_ANGAN